MAFDICGKNENTIAIDDHENLEFTNARRPARMSTILKTAGHVEPGSTVAASAFEVVTGGGVTAWPIHEPMHDSMSPCMAVLSPCMAP